MYSFIQHVLNGVAAGTVYALVALGYTMVYGVLKLINFAHGDVMMVGVYVGYAVAFLLGTDVGPAAGPALAALLVGLGLLCAVAIKKQPERFVVAGANVVLAGLVLAVPSTVRPALVFGAGMSFCALLGLSIERFAYRPLRERPRLTALITAIGISFAISYSFQLDASVTLFGREWTVLPGAASRRFPEIIERVRWFTLGTEDDGVIIWNWQILSIVIAAALMTALQVLVFKTKFGRAMRAVSFDHRIAALMGIPVDRVIALTFALGSALAATAGILYAIKDRKIEPMMGLMVGLKAFVAAVIGGIGHVPGAVLGAIALGLCEEFVAGYTSSSWRDAVAFGFLIVVLLFRPEGLFGRVQAEKV